MRRRLDGPEARLDFPVLRDIKAQGGTEYFGFPVASAYGTHMASYTTDQPGGFSEEQIAQLEPRLELAGLKPAETIPLIAPLLNLPLSDKYPPLPLSPEQQRRRLLATLVEWVIGAARVQPLVIATEDLHWADPSTLELIQLLVE